MGKRKYSKRSITYKNKTQEDRSYEAYLNWRNRYASKGLQLRPMMTKAEFTDYKKLYKDAFGTTTNAAREIAKTDRIIQDVRAYKRMQKKYGEKQEFKDLQQQIDQQNSLIGLGGLISSIFEGLTAAEATNFRDQLETAYY